MCSKTLSFISNAFHSIPDYRKDPVFALDPVFHGMKRTVFAKKITIAFPVSTKYFLNEQYDE